MVNIGIIRGIDVLLTAQKETENNNIILKHARRYNILYVYHGILIYRVPLTRSTYILGITMVYHGP